MSKIIELQAENIKKLRAIEIKPKNNMVLLTGKNGQGKSSILDCITYALMGKSNIPAKPIRNGEQVGQIKLDLGDLIVTRKFTRRGDDEITTSVIVTNKKGAKFNSPQAMLDNLLESITFDPLSFSRMKPKEQFDELRKIIKIDFDFEKIARLSKEYYDKRAAANKENRRLLADVNSCHYPEDTPSEPIDTGELLTIITARETSKALRTNLETEIEEDENKISELQEQIKTEQNNIIDKKVKLESLGIITDREIDELKTKISSSSEINNNVSKKKLKEQLTKLLKESQKEASNNDFMLNKCATMRKEAIENAEMPIEGLLLGNGEVLFNDLPLDQASDAERLKLSCAIAMAGNPDLKILRIKDGALLDSNNLELLQKMAIERDYQIWIEKVDDSGKIGIVIEDGEIKKIND